jgi:hypothetical protein
MQPIGRNVKKSICYCNTRKMWVPPFYIGRRAIGGGVVRGSNVTRIYIRQQHLAVQFNKSLHRRTIREIRVL